MYGAGQPKTSTNRARHANHNNPKVALITYMYMYLITLQNDRLLHVSIEQFYVLKIKYLFLAGGGDRCGKSECYNGQKQFLMCIKAGFCTVVIAIM